MSHSRNPNPIDSLYRSLNHNVSLKVKRNRIFKGILKSYDTHLNVLLENCSYTFKKDDGEGNFVEQKENFDQVIIRGDNIVFIGME
jgi:small nuclear ribonucleoprotein (snRNP)-like protein